MSDSNMKIKNNTLIIKNSKGEIETYSMHVVRTLGLRSMLFKRNDSK